jgi:soluble lytic murein transglycosylase-like protein
LKYHLKEFDSLENVLDPDKNVKYAAKFLKKLFSKHKRWNEAISRYHSSVPKRKKQYLTRVKNYWADIRQKKLILKPNPNNRKKEKIEFFRKELSNQLNRLES